MRNVFVALLCLISLKLSAQIPSQAEIRELFLQASLKEESCRQLVDLLSPFDEKNNALYAGYKACATMMMAKYAFNPFRKLYNFTKGKSLLEKSIEADHENLELRFLRFTVQTNVPGFLNYNKSIPQDKLFILNSISNITNHQLKQLVVSFMAASDYLSLPEKQSIKS